MLFSQLGAVAALGAVGQAFLIPPTISPADNEIVKTLPFEDITALDWSELSITCLGCPVVDSNVLGEGRVAASRIDSVLQFNYSIERGDIDHLLLNGRPIYPIDPTSQTFTELLTVDQLIKTEGGAWVYAASPELGYTLYFHHALPSSNDGHLGLVELRLEIIEFDGRFINQFPAMEIKILETTSGRLMIADAQVVLSKPLSSGPNDGDQECTTIICKWKAIIAAKLSKMKGCGRKRPQHGSTVNSTPTPQGHPTNALAKPFHHGHTRPAHGAHRPHRHHHRHGGFARFLRSIVFHVFIPIMIGVVVGITASVVGMIVGHIAIFIWRILFRRGQRAEYHRVQQEESATKDDDESKSFLEHDNPPPVYEDAPAYEDAVAGEKA